MALLSENHNFCADELDGLVIGVATDRSVHDSGVHFHEKDQLLSSQHGCMTITLENIKYCLLYTSDAADDC